MLPCQYIAIDTPYIDELILPETGSTVTIQEVVVCLYMSVWTVYHYYIQLQSNNRLLFPPHTGYCSIIL